MKNLRISFLKAYSKLIAGLIAMLGYAMSCESMDEYGTPSAKFIVNGNVSSLETNLPVKNIRVIMQADTAFTDADGNYQVVDKWGFPEDQSYAIRFQDIDFEANGTFQDLDTTLEFNDPTFINGDGDWYSGETSKKLDVKLNPKK